MSALYNFLMFCFNRHACNLGVSQSWPYFPQKGLCNQYHRFCGPGRLCPCRVKVTVDIMPMNGVPVFQLIFISKNTIDHTSLGVCRL